MFLKPLKVYDGEFDQAFISVRSDDKQRPATIRWIGFSLYKFRCNQARNEFRRAMVTNHKLLGQIAYADMAFWVERLYHQQRLVPLHCKPEFGRCLLAKGKKPS